MILIPFFIQAKEIKNHKKITKNHVVYKKTTKKKIKKVSADYEDFDIYKTKAYLVKINGKVILEKNADEPLPMASLTKIMTALIVLEKIKPEEFLIVSKNAANETGHRVNIKEGEIYKVYDLLKAALISSGNDACYAIAEYTGGTEENFVRMMNKKAKELGLKNTHFTNPCGHHDDMHYSTAEDLAKLTEIAMKNEIFRNIVRTKETQIETIDGKRTITLKNTNEMLRKDEDVYGVKTGYTPQAGKCLVLKAKKEGRDILVVLLNSKDRWNIAEKILNDINSFAQIDKKIEINN